ncbi:MAG TPA: nucleotide sugar dehydrogenase [Caulifigura sp.]|nr:nucleotide sugar dehydrogenase [Caulifigura sp.]
MSRVAIIGLSDAGCVSAGCLSRDGHRVVCVDLSEEKVARLKMGVAPVSEPKLDHLIRRGVENGSITATMKLHEAVAQTDIALVTVGTPSARAGRVNTTAVERVVRGIGEVLAGSDRPYTVVVRSTLLPGVLEERLAPILDDACGYRLGANVRLCNNPAFLRKATAVSDYDRPPFIIVGADHEEAAKDVLALYERIAAERIVTDTRTAALIKYTSNAFHAVKVAFANEIGTLAQSLGTDGQRVMEIVCRDKQLNISKAYLKPGFAFGGSYLPKDLRAINRVAQEREISSPLLASVLPSNEAHLERAVALVEDQGCREIGLVGLSFKPGTDDLRDSPMARLAEILHGRGYQLRIFDPCVRVSGLVGSNLSYVDQHLPHLSALMVDSAEKLLEHAQLLILGSDAFDRSDLQTTFPGPVIDLRHDLVAAIVEGVASR